MSSIRRVRSVTFLTTMVVLAACGGDDDDGVAPDASGMLDGSVVDSSGPHMVPEDPDFFDASIPPIDGGETDGGEEDAGPAPTDAGGETDAAGAVDAGNGTDAGAVTDAGADAGTDVDADAGTDVDAGADAGTDVDASIVADAGVDAGGTDGGTCPPHASDLSIHFISRTPRYPMAQVEYEPFGFNPRLSAASASAKLYPDLGEPTTFTARIVNQGSSPSPAAHYVFRMDGEPVAEGPVPALAPGAGADVSFAWAWQDGPHVVRVELDAGVCGALADPHPVNDVREQRTNALMFTIYTWPSFERWMAEHENALGTRSGADWIRFEADEMNRLFETSRSDVAPEGVRIRIAIDRIVPAEGRAFPGGGTPPPEPCPTESCWNFGGPDEGLEDWLVAVGGGRDQVTMHEWAHQIGLMDVYRLNIQDFQVKVTDWFGGRTYSNSDGGSDLRALFDHDPATGLTGIAGVQAEFAIEIPDSSLLAAPNHFRVRFAEGTTHRWRLFSGSTIADALALRRARTESVTTTGADESGSVDVTISRPDDDARAWLLEVERLDGGPPEIREWELWIRGPRGSGSEITSSIPGALDRRPIANTPLLPNEGGDIVRWASVREDLMNGGIPYILHPWTQWGLDVESTVDGRDIPLRRGWFGHYLFFIPTRNVVTLTYLGQPVQHASVEIFHQTPGPVPSSTIPDVPKFVVVTDGEGRFTFPDVTTLAYARSVGRSEPLAVRTPFSSVESPDPNVLGTNSVLMLRVVDRMGSRWYAFLDVAQFNLEYARGHTEEGTYAVGLGAPVELPDD